MAHQQKCKRVSSVEDLIFSAWAGRKPDCFAPPKSLRVTHGRWTEGSAVGYMGSTHIHACHLGRARDSSLSNSRFITCEQGCDVINNVRKSRSRCVIFSECVSLCVVGRLPGYLYGGGCFEHTLTTVQRQSQELLQYLPWHVDSIHCLVCRLFLNEASSHSDMLVA